MEEEDKKAERDLEILKNYQKKEAKSIKKIFPKNCMNLNQEGRDKELCLKFF